MVTKRSAVLDELARAVSVISLPPPLRVAVDGFSAAGKTTLADELADLLQSRGRSVLRAELDDFHRPGHKYRSIRGEWTPALYLAEGYQYEVFRRVLLEPLGPGGDLRCRTGVWDSYRDEPIAEEWVEVDQDAIALIDGMFLLGPQLASHFDFGIWLEIGEETVISRARARDVAWVGSADEVEARYRRLWLPLHALYAHTLRPRDRADVVIQHDDVEEPHTAWAAPMRTGKLR